MMALELWISLGKATFSIRQWKGLLWQKQLQREEQAASTECALTIHEIIHCHRADVQDHGNKSYSYNIQWLFQCAYKKVWKISMILWTYEDWGNFCSPMQKKMYYSPFSSTRIHQTRDQEIFLSVIYHFHKQEGKNTSRFLGIHPWNLLGYTTAHSYISYTEMLATLVTVYLLKIIATT